MKYQMDKKRFNDFSVYSMGELPHRAFFVPFTSREEAAQGDRWQALYRSDRVTVLSGEWDFAYYPHIAQLPDTVDTDTMTFDRIPVPSCWSRLGYEAPYYSNVAYLFDFTAPLCPQDISVGVYRHKFTPTAAQLHGAILSLLGVSGAYNLYVNGQFVGYHEVSHNTAEFDVTPYLTEGENELVLVLHKWSNATYLECQDMFRDNGIFRDVYLISKTTTYLYDYAVTSKYSEDGYTVECRYTLEGEGQVTFSVTDGDSDILAAPSAEGVLQLHIASPREWSAEVPNLYPYMLSVLGADGTPVEYVGGDIGLKHIEIKDSVFYLNSQPIKLLGINHHDTNTHTGYVLDVDFLEREIRLMKEYNVNCMRTSHYPPDPRMLQLADYYGIYVVDEADIETHGAAVKHIDCISADLTWESRYVDRVAGMFERDKNRACVVMWSLGNESGWGVCHDRCYDYLRARTPIPVHYEGSSRSPRMHYDVFSKMYESIEGTIAIGKREGNDGRYNVPFYQCEYAHAMGVGPGGLEDYVEAYLKYPSLMGGCIWEWADHAVYHAEGKYRYTYGGDHGEKNADKNFCCDGLFLPDRTPSIGARQMQVVYRAVREESAHGKITLRNENRFRDTSYLKISYAIQVDGIAVASGEVSDIIPPMSSLSLDIDLVPYLGCDSVAIFTYKDINTGAEYKYGLTIDSLVAGVCKPKSICSEIQRKYVFRRSDGTTEVLKDGTIQLLGGRILPRIYCAPIDNYPWYRGFAKSKGIDRADFRLVRSRQDGKEITLVYVAKLAGCGKLRVQQFISVSDTGDLFVTMRFGNPFLKAIDMLRIGAVFTLPAAYSKVKYYGRGPGENYRDLNAYAPLGIYTATTDDFYEVYLRPQENGNRTDVRWAEISNGEDMLKITANGKALNFKADHIDQQSLIAATHPEEVRDSDCTNVYIDGFVRGVGSGSCGPDTETKHRRRIGGGKYYEFSFVLSTTKQD